MATWAELNQSAGGSVQSIPSPSQSGGWASANARAIQALGASGSPQQTATERLSRQQILQEEAISRNPVGSPFLRDTVIAPAPASNKKLEILGVRINKPTSIYGTKTGQPIIDVDPNRFEARASENANFVQKMGAVGLNTIGQSITGIGNSLGKLFDIGIIDTQAKREIKAGISPENSPLPEIRERASQGLPARPTVAEKTGAVINVGAQVAGGAFTPIAAELAMAEELPVIGKPVFGTINKGFELLDHASRFVGTKVVDLLPVDDQSREVLRQPIEDLAGIVGTLFGVKAVHVAGSKGGGRVVDALPVSEATKGQIRGGVQLGASVTLSPFGTAYRGIVGTIKTKVESRQALGEQITPEVAQRIVNETVKQTKVPNIEAIMEVPTTEGKTRVYTNQKLVLENLIKNNENLNYKVVDDLGIQLKTDTPITSRFEWDYAKQQGTIYTTNKTTAVDLARELGHYVDRQLGSALSTRLSEALPNYRENRDQINQLLADYALERLGGNAKHSDINAEIVKIADNISSEIKNVRVKEEKQRPANEFAQAVGDIINDPLRRKQSPELSQLIDFSLGSDVNRKGGKADIVGEAGTKAEKESLLAGLTKAQKDAIKATREGNATFQQQRLAEEMRRQGIFEQGELASTNFDWKEISKALRDSSEFKKEGTITDRTFDGVLMEKNGKFRVVPLSDVKKLQRQGWESRFGMDEIANANGFESAEAYSEYIMKLDAELRDLGRTSEQRAAHEYLLKNDENYAKLEETINNFRERLKEGEETVYGAEQPTGQVDRTAPIEQKVAGEATKATETVKKDRTTEVKKETTGSEFGKGISKTSKRIAQEFVEQKLNDAYSGLAEYDKINKKDQARRASELINTDLDKAMRIIKGEESLPEGMRAGALLMGMREFLKKDASHPELEFEFLNSKLMSETSIHAQELGLLAERLPDSPEARSQELKRARRTQAEKTLRQGETLDQVTKKARNELKEKIKESRPKKEDWSSFINSIKC